MEKLLTIVIPAYNMERYLDRCISSLLLLETDELQQTEVIVVNDGSTDGTSTLAHCYEERYSDVVRVVDKENGNYGSCINKGLELATGRYIKILDADDWFDVDAYAQFVNNLKKIDVDLVVTDFNQVDTDNHIISRSHLCEKDVCTTTTLDNFPDYLQMHSLCYRTEMLREHHYVQTTGISYTDTEWSIIPLLYVKTMVCLPICLYQYLVGRDGQTMEASVLYNRRGHLIKTLTKCVEWLNRERKKGCESYYVEGRTNMSISFLYYTILIENKGKECADLVAFDWYLQRQAPYVYNHLEADVSDEASQFHFVKAWRQNNFVLPDMPSRCKLWAFFNKCRIHTIWLWETKVLHRQ
jgi:glycosyltransferase involved in cell wall biosynthesis